MTASTLAADSLASLADIATQRHAARLAQDAFARAFRLSVGEAEETARGNVAELRAALGDWAGDAADEDARALRLALLLSGLDQWGLAWSEAFGLTAIPALSALIGSLRTGLDARDEARFLRYFEAIAAAEENAVDFKIELRRSIHLALWHSAIAAEDRDEALRLAGCLGSLLLGLTRAMPVAGWRLVADALASIQIRCLADGLAADGIGQEATQALFAALARELPADVRDAVMAHAAQATLAWRQSRRPH